MVSDVSQCLYLMSDLALNTLGAQCYTGLLAYRGINDSMAH